VKLSNVGSRVIVNNVRGYLQSRIVYFLMNLNVAPRSFYISRHGESMFNLEQKIGGNSSLSAQGQVFAMKVPLIMKDQVGSNTKLTIWTSTLKRTIETSQHLPYPKVF
jgi:6-phosphofructo-2-kinase / fructose-2,6-biphosphatase 2